MSNALGEMRLRFGDMTDDFCLLLSAREDAAVDGLPVPRLAETVAVAELALARRLRVALQTLEASLQLRERDGVVLRVVALAVRLLAAVLDVALAHLVVAVVERLVSAQLTS